MSPTRTARVVAGLIAALALLLLGAPIASAHDVIESSDPADGVSMATGPARVSVTLNEAPQGSSTLTVVGPDGKRYEQGTAATEGETLSVGVSPLGPAGRYEIGYRFVSSDGHPVTGALAFSLTAPGPAAAPPAGDPAGTAAAAPGADPAGRQPSSAAGQEAASADAAAEDSGIPAWPFVVLAVVVVAGAVALALRRRPG